MINYTPDQQQGFKSSIGKDINQMNINDRSLETPKFFIEQHNIDFDNNKSNVGIAGIRSDFSAQENQETLDYDMANIKSL